MKMDVIILAGGAGTRLRPVVKDIPKPMADINGRPFLHYLLGYLQRFNVNSFVFSAGYKPEVIQDYFGDEFSGIPVRYAVEQEPLGTGGGIRLAMEKCTTEQVLVLNGDTFFRIDPDDMLQKHLRKRADLSICLRKLNDVSRFGTIEANADERITAFREKSGKSGPGFVNGGIYIFNRSVLAGLGLPDKFSVETDLFERFTSKLRMFAYRSEGYFIDIGIPEEYRRAQEEFRTMGL
jgi:D-glycero-alpha-D-manno-heptose 1-phosphate guanylyltransferase